jgi:hypothetical protein
MEFKSERPAFSRSKLTHSAKQRLLRPASLYKSVNSTSTIFHPPSPSKPRPLCETHNNYLATRAQSAKYPSISTLT